MLFSQARKRKVVSSSTAETIGKVSDFVVDPATRSVVAVTLKKSEDGDVLRWADLTAFGTDAVTVTGADKVRTGDERVQELSGKDHRLLGKRVLTSGGDELGKLDDVGFDAETGGLTTLLVEDGPEVPAERLLGVGSFAVVVAEDEPGTPGATTSP
jgi:sporulation protein YlmC with PRC-barrel domain